MLKLEQILRKTPKDRVKRARDGCRVVSAKVGKTKKGNKILRAVLQDVNSPTTTRKGQPYKHKAYIKTIVPGTKLSKSNVKVSCDCDDFWSHWEVALHKKGAADIKHSNGKLPTETNPRLVPGVCKHLYKLGRYILNKNM